MYVFLQTQILFLLKASKKIHQNIPDKPSINTNVQTQFEFLEDSSDKLFLSFSAQVYKWIRGYLFHSALQSRIRCYGLLGA